MDAEAQAELAGVDAADQVPGRVAQALEHAQRLLPGELAGGHDVLEHEHRRRLHQRQPLEHRREGAALLHTLGDGALEAVEAVLEQPVAFEVTLEVERSDGHAGRQLDHTIDAGPRPQRRLGEVGGGDQPVQIAMVADDREVRGARLAPTGQQRGPVEALLVGQHVDQDALEAAAEVGVEHELSMGQPFDPVPEGRERLACSLGLGRIARR